MIRSRHFGDACFQALVAIPQAFIASVAGVAVAFALWFWGRLGSTLARDGVCVGNTRLSNTSIGHIRIRQLVESGRGKHMILVLINVLIIVVIGALIFYLIDRFVRDGRLANLLKILVVLICLAAILQRLLPALGVSLF